MKETLVTFKTAKLAKEKEFELIQDYFYDPVNHIPKEEAISYHEKNNYIEEAIPRFLEAPIQSLLQKWLREKHKIHVYVTHKQFAVDGEDGYYFHIGLSCSNHYFGKFKTYEDALEMGLQKALKLIKI